MKHVGASAARSKIERGSELVRLRGPGFSSHGNVYGYRLNGGGVDTQINVLEHEKSPPAPGWASPESADSTRPGLELESKSRFPWPRPAPITFSFSLCQHFSASRPPSKFSKLFAQAARRKPGLLIRLMKVRAARPRIGTTSNFRAGLLFYFLSDDFFHFFFRFSSPPTAVAFFSFLFPSSFSPTKEPRLL